MATFTKQLLSGSNNGQQILIVGTAGNTATLIHTAVAGTSALDEVWVYAYNDDTVNRNLNLLWGGTAEPGNVQRVVIPPKTGRALVVDGMVLRNGLAVKAYSDAANVVLIDGYVNNIA